MVGVDGRSLEEQRTGIGRYLENLLRELARLCPSWHIRVYTLGPPPADPFLHQAPCECVRVGFAGAAQAHVFSAELVTRPPHVFFSPLYELPDPLDMPAVITVHDMIHEATPDAFLPVQLDYLRSRHAYALERADRVITDSSFSRQEIVGRFPHAAPRIAVVPLAADPTFSSGAPAEHAAHRALLQAELQLCPPYFLYVGSIAAKRHVLELLEAFREVKGHRLVLVGTNFLRQPALLDEALARAADTVVHRPYVSLDVLRALYRHATAFCYLSTYEGFGMPPLEAMACATPVLAVRAAAVPEVVGDAAWLLEDATDVRAIRHALRCLAEDASLRQRLIARGRACAARYDWRETARRTAIILEEAATSGRSGSVSA